MREKARNEGRASFSPRILRKDEECFFDVGEFGDVYKGKLTKPNKKKITVAVKL